MRNRWPVEDGREVRRFLREHLDEKHKNLTIDRCTVGRTACNRKPIEAHCISRAALSLIAESGKVVGCAPGIMRSGYDINSRPFFSEIGVKLFNRGKWACEKHDKIFGPIDSVNINVHDNRVLFLQVYRATAYAAHALLQASEMTDLDTRIFDLVDELYQFPSNASQKFAEKRTRVAEAYNLLKDKMDELLAIEDYNALEYRVARWKSKPSMAAIAMWCNPTMWTVLLPQEHGHTLITASTRWGSSVERRVHGNMPQEGKRDILFRPNTWTRKVSQRILEDASILAFRPTAWKSLTEEEQKRIEDYMRERSIRDIRRENLTNLLKI